ncbi:MAG TPA: helix-turn-helix transcriptional regulator [Bacteroidia bacterium]|nr:helix-turn-helix transcriptional regulator [Bacteroidia bacterium]
MKLENDLKKLRNSKGYTLEDVAKKLNMDCKDRLSQWERGTAVPGLLNLFKLSVLYDTLPHELYPKPWKALLTEYLKS